MELKKVKSYLGFAKKSRNLVFGVEDILKLKNVYLILVSNELAESSKNKLQKLSEIKKISYINLSSSQMFEICELQAVKALALTDNNLAKAIKDNLLTGVSDGGNFE